MFVKVIFRIFLLLFLLLKCYSPLSAQTAIKVTNDYTLAYIGKQVMIFQDSTKRKTLDDIINQKFSFKPSNARVPNFGVNNFNNWLKFKVINDSDKDRLVLGITNPTIDRAELYTIADGKRDSSIVSLTDSYDKKIYNHQFYAFSLDIKKGDSVECYLNLSSTKQLLVPLTISDRRSIIDEILGFDFRSGIYIGIMVALLLYNLFLYISARDRHYLAYVNYIFWVSIAQAAILGYLQRFFQWSDFLATNLVTFSGAMSGIASVVFVKSFLNTEYYVPKLHRWLNIIILCDFIAIVLLFFNLPLRSYELVNIVAGLGSVVVLTVGYKAYQKGNRSAKLFLIAWGIFLSSVIVYVLKDYGLLSYNLFTVHSVQIGASLEALLLSFALADKINIYRKEKEQSQARELAISLENEKLIREQNVILEQRVEERTHALKESNDSLQQTLAHLKEAQSQLVESEKMASLGQLTAGVAHEINNPINFVSSNVAPLKRDVNMVWETLDEVERIALMESLSVEERKKLITAYKEEVDIDYLKTEMEFLLKGMHDGAHRTAEIVKSLRIFSRVDEDTLKLADLNEGIESTLVILSSVLKEGITVETHYGDLPKVECHAGKLNQVFLNILTNAVFAINQKFQNGNGGKLLIETGLYDDMSAVYIKISDNGTGIPKAVREKIFEPFFTTKDVGEGTGLGMSIAYNTVAKHQGKILLESEEGEGTVFTLIIPIQQNI